MPPCSGLMGLGMGPGKGGTPGWAVCFGWGARLPGVFPGALPGALTEVSTGVDPADGAAIASSPIAMGKERPQGRAAIPWGRINPRRQPGLTDGLTGLSLTMAVTLRRHKKC